MLVRIESESNSRLKLVSKLKTRRGRVNEGLFAAEGINLIRQAAYAGSDIRFILVPDTPAGDELQEFIDSCISAGKPDVCVVPQHVFDKITDAGHGVGVLAVAGMPANDPGMAERIAEDSNILVLDRIQDPGNIGTMIRTAVAAGYGMIIAIKGTADIYSPKVLRSTAGMIFEIPFAYVDSADELEKLLRRTGRRIAVTDPAQGVPYYEADLSRNIALVIGNEGNGISDEVMELADIRVNIPMKGNTESLNAAVSASILMYEAVRNH